MYSGAPTAHPWTPSFSESLAGVTLAASNRGTFRIPYVNLYTTFFLWVPVWTAGNITLSLRFGIDGPTAGAAVEGINFPVLATANDSRIQSVAWVVGAAAPNIPGSAPGILPPHVAVIVTTAAGTTLDYVVFYACVDPQG